MVHRVARDGNAWAVVLKKGRTPRGGSLIMRMMKSNGYHFFFFFFFGAAFFAGFFLGAAFLAGFFFGAAFFLAGVQITSLRDSVRERAAGSPIPTTQQRVRWSADERP